MKSLEKIDCILLKIQDNQDMTNNFDQAVKTKEGACKHLGVCTRKDQIFEKYEIF